MKKLLIGTLIFGLASLSYSQNTTSAMKEVTLSNVEVTPVNLTYLNSVQDINTPRSVMNLENRAARYNIRKSEVFNKDFDAYEVVFSQPNGNIFAVYDRNGKILSTYEKYEDLTPAHRIRNAIYKDFPGWTISEDTYLVSYDRGDIKKFYKVEIRKDNKKRKLRLDVNGNKM